MGVIELSRTEARTAFRLDRPQVSGIVRPRALLAGVLLAAATGLVFAAGIGTGDYPMSLGEVLRALAGRGDYGTLVVVHEFRLPRALVGLMVGASFGIAGAVFQTLTRNPLASPDMIGLTSGATTAVVAGIVLGFGTGWGPQAMAVAGGLASAAAIYLLAWKRGATGYRIVLVGIGISWMCTSATSYLLVKADLWEAQQVMRWLVGSLNASDWVHVRPLSLAMLLAVPAVLLLARWLRLLQLGDDVAIGLGVPVRWAQLGLVGTAVVLMAFGTAATGPILFVALTAPHIAQRLTALTAPPLVASGLTGALLVTGADLLARQVVPDTPLPIGVVTGVLGGVFLLWLLLRANRVGTGG